MVAVGHLTASQLSKLRSKMPVDPRAQRAGRHRAGLARNLAAAAHEDHGRDCLDLKARGKLPFGVGIDLGEPQPRLKLLCGGFESRSHGAARSAPGRPEIDQQRQVGRVGVAIEMRRIEIDRMPGEQRLMAAAAFAAFAAPFRRHAVERMAMRAGDGDGAGHGRFSQTRPSK